MVSFIIGIVVGGCAAVFVVALASTNQKADSMESDYYKNRFLKIVDRIEQIIGSFRSNKMDADDAMNQIENELKL